MMKKFLNASYILLDIWDFFKGKNLFLIFLQFMNQVFMKKRLDIFRFLLNETSCHLITK